MDTHLGISLSIRYLRPLLSIALPALDGLDVIILVLLMILHDRELRHLRRRLLTIWLMDTGLRSNYMRV